MEIYLFLIPLIGTILSTIFKMKMVKNKSDKKSTLKEFIIDLIKFTIVYSILISTNVFFEIDLFKFSTMFVDFILMSVSFFVLTTKNYKYDERKAILGLVSGALISAVIAISMFNMIIGTYNISDATYAMLFIKLVISFALSMWAVFTAYSVTFKDKLKSFFTTLLYSFKEYNIDRMSYYGIALLLLVFFMGGPNNLIEPVGLFGLHEIVRRKYTKGVFYILSANIILVFSTSLIGQLLYLLYLLIATIDLCWTFFKFKEINFQKNL